MKQTDDLIKLIGSPFQDSILKVSSETLINIYDKAFADRVALLYLDLHRKKDWYSKLEEAYINLNKRREKTISVIADLADVLNDFWK